jgi:hypothetical protein
MAKDPSWVKDPSRACKKSELCAVGEGVSINSANREARLGISKIFNTQIKSKFKTTLTSNNSFMSEQTTDEVEEVTNGIVEGVEIKKTHETKTGYYAFAVLNKRKAANALKKEITKLDEKMKVLLSEGSNASKVKVEQIYLKREAFNKKVAFLTGFEVPSNLSYEEVFKARREAAAKMVVHVFLNEEGVKHVEATLLEALSRIGYKTSSGNIKNKLSTHLVTGDYVAEKQHLNVDGFVKYRFLLKLKASTSRRVESGALTFSVVETGRSLAQAKENALPKVKEFISENIDKLNIE